MSEVCVSSQEKGFRTWPAGSLISQQDYQELLTELKHSQVLVVK